MKAELRLRATASGVSSSEWLNPRHPFLIPKIHQGTNRVTSYYYFHFFKYFRGFNVKAELRSERQRVTLALAIGSTIQYLYLSSSILAAYSDR
ncbi:MAG: hypothetical protein AB3N10_04850, partial [Allomuricauda sp.]